MQFRLIIFDIVNEDPFFRHPKIKDRLSFTALSSRHPVDTAFRKHQLDSGRLGYYQVRFHNHIDVRRKMCKRITPPLREMQNGLRIVRRPFK
ncbi:hypothetical protein SBA4_1380003 [Candidatus Sulfopaludibacter sp. SbA4]|nr:hypothetical protein SBA4_1380003 [Candidatus Sulfopaludibacter sp. SbA4]